MSTAIGKTKAIELITGVRSFLGEYPEKYPNKAILRDINDLTSELVEISGAMKDPQYRGNETVVAAGNSGGLVPASNGCTYTNSTKSVYIPAGLWAGLFSTGITDATDLPIGAIIMFHTTTGPALIFNSTILSITDATHFILKDAYGGNLASTDFNIVVMIPGTAAATVDLSGLATYKDIIRITDIEDTLDNEYAEKSQKDYLRLKKQGSGSPYSECIIWYWEGNTLYFSVGSDVTAMGTRTIHYTRRIKFCVELTDYIDAKQELIPLIQSAVTLKVLQAIGQKIPAELVAEEKKLANLRKGYAEGLAKELSNAKTQ